MRKLALELVVEARTRVLAAQRVLDMMAQLKVEPDQPMVEPNDKNRSPSDGS